jgi:selT/selW/selH-like putative selenoprotein
LTLIPSGGGAFEVKVNGNLVWSKKKTHDFPEYSAIAEAVSADGY